MLIDFYFVKLYTRIYSLHAYVLAYPALGYPSSEKRPTLHKSASADLKPKRNSKDNAKAGHAEKPERINLISKSSKSIPNYSVASICRQRRFLIKPASLVLVKETRRRQRDKTPCKVALITSALIHRDHASANFQDIFGTRSLATSCLHARNPAPRPWNGVSFTTRRLTKSMRPAISPSILPTAR